MVSPPAPRPPLASADAVRACVRQALALRYLDCLQGDWPDGAVESVGLGEPRLRALRQSPRMNLMFSASRIERFWLRDRAWLTLTAAIMLRCPPVVPQAEAVSIPALARISGLSEATVQAALTRGTATGDFTKQRAAHDRRQLVLHPSEAMVATALGSLTGFYAMVADFCGRAAPDPALLLAHGGLPFLRLGMRQSAHLGRGAPAAEVAARRNFFFTLWDLLLEPGAASAGFVQAQAGRLRVTLPTVRAVLEEAREGGWLEPGRDPVPSAMARQRFIRLFSLAERRWALLLEALEAVMARPEWAAALDPEEA